MTTTRRAYLVLATQRSGSTLLVESLRATGIAGEPQEFFQYLPHSGLAPQPREWFADVTDESILSLLDPLDPGTPRSETGDEWAERIRREGSTANGVWGGKLMWNQTPLLLANASGLRNRSGDDLRSAIDDLLGPDVVFVHVYRTDIAAQAVSMWRAVQTRVWRGAAPAEIDERAQYHAGGIAHLHAILSEQERSWRAWFDTAGVEPIEIDYRHLAEDTTGEVGRVLSALGLDPALAPPPALTRQGNARSVDWIERYRRDAAREGVTV
ncbi:trehalose 2-sulfotransferase [Williamsia phyllosphaerae]|uniref:Trehalose 2-sulfotransferase n=1 Tax=Williamsia phyllosphaerae TaxID=885042 RepID=A0ABQ1V361_9NOCA|nr:Stf0 family sulfotransferase [Williamsia phyllosphaerae]GGF36819.1 hypothetical protein GCM10007298_35670 [Williamsia phyllosphaerae]